MAIRDLTARIRLLADTTNLQQGLGKADSSFTKLSKNLAKAGLAITAVFLTVRESFQAFEKAVVQVAQEDALNRQLEKLGTDLESFLDTMQAVAKSQPA